jgi:sugar/nucleoside kinase (ribokinase family)
VGRDYFGRYIIDTLAGAGVDVGEIHQLEDTETSGTLIVNVKGQDRRFIHSVGANAKLTTDHIDLERVKASKVLYIGGYLLMPGMDPRALAELFRRARAWGVKTVLDVVLPGAGDHWNNLAPVLKETDVFLPNTDEAAVITSTNDPVEQAERFLNAGARTVVITCGAKGSVLLTDSLRLRAGVYPIEYRGGTGSGDAFDAGFIAGLLNNEDAAGCLRWGTAVGASCVRSISATDGVFHRAEAAAFMNEHSLAVENF